MLNPPLIDSKLPAQYGTTLTIPYADNRAVSKNDYKKLRAKIKTISTNTILGTFDSTNNTVAEFQIDSDLIVGQYYKIQLCYLTEEDLEGQYSTVGIFKYTQIPSITITNSNDSISFTGTYTINDSTERVDKYKFDICKKLENETIEVLETSGWIIHPKDTDVIIDGQLTSADSYNRTFLTPDIFIVKYSIMTINGLQESIITEEIDNPFTFTPDTSDDEVFNLSLDFDTGRITISHTAADAKILLRSEDAQHWQTITDNFINHFTDQTVEQGVRYYYALGTDNFYTYKSIVSDFEDIILSDKNKILRVRFNPKVSSFKNTIQESKQDTIGGVYPIFVRNGRLKYKEFQISGLISRLLENDSTSMTIRDTTPSKNIETCEFSTNLSSTNIYNERKFKLQILEWLTDGELKLFRSPQEGNYIVRLMNISLSPEDTLGRMIHTFSATAYEAKEFNFENLRIMNLLPERGTQQ